MSLTPQKQVHVVKCLPRLVSHPAAVAPFCYPTRQCKMHESTREFERKITHTVCTCTQPHTYVENACNHYTKCYSHFNQQRAWTHPQRGFCSWKYTPDDLVSAPSVCVRACLYVYMSRAEHRVKCFSKAQQDFPIRSSRKINRGLSHVLWREQSKREMIRKALSVSAICGDVWQPTPPSVSPIYRVITSQSVYGPMHSLKQCEQTGHWLHCV